MRRAGYSLVELMVTVSIVGIVVAASVPNLRSYRESQRLQRATEVVASTVAEAKSISRSHNTSVFLEYRLDDGVVALVEDTDGDGVADDSEHQELKPVGEGLALAATSFTDDKLVFDSRGTALAGGSVFLTGSGSLSPKRVRVAVGTAHVSIRSVESVGDEN